MSDSNTYTQRYSDGIDIEDIDITLSFDLGNAVIPVSHLSQLREGYTFNLKDNQENEVFIKSAGQLIAKGEIVKINENIGVQITEIKHGISW